MMRMARNSLYIAFSVLSLSLTSPAQAKAAKCDVTLSGNRYVGPCDFVSGKKGSFELFFPEKAEDIIETSYMVVDIISAGVARLSGTVPGLGKLNDWGIVRRDPKKPACWIDGMDRICVY